MPKSALMILLVSGMAVAQDKPVPQGDRPIPVGEDRSVSSLPAFDLPDFVITGRESIDIPVAEKKEFSDELSGRAIERPVSTPLEREDPDMIIGDMFRAITRQPSSHMLRAYLGIGSFSGRMVGVQAGGAVEQMHLQGDAAYSSTEGFEPNTDATHLHLVGGVRAPTSVFSGDMDRERASLSFGFSRDAYLWYGSSRPTNDRTLSSGRGSIGMEGSFRNGLRGLLSFHYAGGTVTDTSARVSEGIFGVNTSVEGDVLGLPSGLTVRIMSGGKSGGSGGSYGSVDAAVDSRWEPAPGVSTKFSAGVASYYGEAGQRKTVFLPGFSASFEISPSHRFIGTYAPGLALQDLVSSVGSVPFLDASDPIRYAFAGNRGSIGVESNWSSMVRSSISLESARWTDYPVISDTSGFGVFRLFYGEITETLIKASVVAKLPANHYFSAIAIVRSSKRSASGVSVPYLPSSELRLSYRNQITEQFEAEGTVQAVSSREMSAFGPSSTVGGYTRADVRVTYTVVSGLKVWAAARNLLDATIEHWKGYQESPFTLSIGMSYSL